MCVFPRSLHGLRDQSAEDESDLPWDRIVQNLCGHTILTTALRVSHEPRPVQQITDRSGRARSSGSFVALVPVQMVRGFLLSRNF